MHANDRALIHIVETKGRLPPVLFLQMDNCWRENKNWIMFSYLSWLIESRAVKKVFAGYQIVG